MISFQTVVAVHIGPCSFKTGSHCCLLGCWWQLPTIRLEKSGVDTSGRVQNITAASYILDFTSAAVR